LTFRGPSSEFNKTVRDENWQENDGMTLQQTLMRRRSWCLAAWGLAILTYAVWPGSHTGAAQRPGSGRDQNEATAGYSEQPGTRVREGTVLDTTGYFKVSGDRALFTTADGTARYTGLENLNLERVAIAVSENPDQLLWNVTGTVTEYRGTNYLLVTRALLKSKPAAPKASERAAAKGGVASK
jgi:hypothetical protein